MGHARRAANRSVMIDLGLALAACLAACVPTLAGPPTRLEMHITDNGPDFSAGEPQIAINPLNPNNLFIDYATFPVPVPQPPTGPAPAHACGGYVSMDRGQSWQASYIPFPTQSASTFSQCADGVAAFGPDGTLYTGGDANTALATPGEAPNCPPGSVAALGKSCVEPQGNDPFARSTDGGKTWTILPFPFGSPDWCPTCKFAPGSGHPHDVFDRPFVVVDQSTGIVYISSRGILDHERFVTASKDKGDSFGQIFAVDSPVYPESGSDSNIVVIQGVLAVAYTAAPAAGGCDATCMIFETSTDFGATWNRHVVPLANASGAPRPFIAAFAGHDGKRHDGGSIFALTVLDTTGMQNQVYTTSNLGKPWQGPTAITDSLNPHFKPWLSFCPSGQLVLLWRTWHGTPRSPTTPYDVWAAVGRVDEHNGAVFGTPLKVSSVAAPLGSGGGGDDFSYVICDNEFVHAAWGDSRSGATQVWYSRIPLKNF